MCLVLLLWSLVFAFDFLYIILCLVLLWFSLQCGSVSMLQNNCYFIYLSPKMWFGAVRCRTVTHAKGFFSPFPIPHFSYLSKKSFLFSPSRPRHQAFLCVSTVCSLFKTIFTLTLIIILHLLKLSTPFACNSSHSFSLKPSL